MDPPLHTPDILAHTHTNQTMSLGYQHGDGPTWAWANRAGPTLWGHVPTSTDRLHPSLPPPNIHFLRLGLFLYTLNSS